MWEYAFHFHFCSLVTLAALALFPAECAFTYYGYESLINQTRFIHQFHGFRDGTLTVIRFNDIEGLISFPSFHVAGAMMVTWAFRRHRWFFVPLLCLNAVMAASTVMLGAHYATDLVATALMFGASVIIYRRWGERLLARKGLVLSPAL
jgi:membrane-associated phospholipid phosphatase